VSITLQPVFGSLNATVSDRPGLEATAIDYRTAWFGFGMALAIGGMSCLLPLWRMCRGQGQIFLAEPPKSPAAGGNRRI